MGDKIKRFDLRLRSIWFSTIAIHLLNEFIAWIKSLCCCDDDFLNTIRNYCKRDCEPKWISKWNRWIDFVQMQKRTSGRASGPESKLEPKNIDFVIEKRWIFSASVRHWRERISCHWTASKWIVQLLQS